MPDGHVKNLFFFNQKQIFFGVLRVQTIYIYRMFLILKTRSTHIKQVPSD